MLSMYDIFLLIRPKHIHIWGEIKDVDISGILDEACQRAKIHAGGGYHDHRPHHHHPGHSTSSRIIDIMIKKHVRRLPVLEAGKMVGMVYMSRVFQHLLEGFSE